MANLSEIRVMVHPHFVHVGSLEKLRAPLSGSEVPQVVLRAKERIMAGDSEPAQIKLSELGALHRFYKHEIDRVKKTPGAVLVFVAGVYGIPNHENKLFMDAGIPKEIAENMTLHSISLQDRLMRYAARRLGKRLLITDLDLKNVGHWINKKANGRASISDIPVSIFGEYLGACVNIVHSNMKKAGFGKVKINESKSF